MQATQQSPSLGTTISKEEKLSSEAYDLTLNFLLEERKKKKRNQTSPNLGRERMVSVGKDGKRLRGSEAGKGHDHTGQRSSGG